MFIKSVMNPFVGMSILLFPMSIFPTIYTVTTGTDSAVDIGGHPGELRYILNTILNDQALNATSTDRVIQFDVNYVTLEGILPMINLFHGDPIQINVGGSSVTIDGGGFRPFFIAQGNNITLENLHITNGKAIGGTGGIGGAGTGTGVGGGGGGGGMGAGGALFVDNATVILNNVSFSSNHAIGGKGGLALGAGIGSGGGGGLGGSGGQGFDQAAGGGGGYSGNGGNGFGNAGGGGGSFGNGGSSGSFTANNAGGGGGGAIIGANGGSGNGFAGIGVTGFVFGGGGAGGSPDDLTDGGSGGGTNGGIGGSSNGGGGGGGYNGTSGTEIGGTGGIGGGGGGGGGSTSDSGYAAAGGLGGGGGGSAYHGFGGAGGYGGGGGGVAGGYGVGGFGGGGSGGGFGFGGFGGGGGAGDFGGGGFGGGGGGGYGNVFTGLGGVGAGVGSAYPPSGGDSGGGGGAGFGGAIFLNTGTIIFQGDGFITGGSLTAGSGGTPLASPGFIAGTDIFLVSGAGLTFAPRSGEKIHLSGAIADDSSTSVPGGSGITPGSGLGGGIIKNGLGTLLLQGINTYMGGTNLNSGTLIVNGKIVGFTIVAAGANLKGSGSVGNVTLGGTLSPGDNAIGSLTLNSIDFLSGSTLAIALDPAEASFANVIGSATISGPTTIYVSENSGSYSSDTSYTVLQASGPISGVSLLSIESKNPNYQFLIDTSVPNQINIILQVVE